MASGEQKTCIVVLGMHRSGTSLLSGLLGHIGFEHSDRLMPANFANPAGFWEPAEVVNLNNRLLVHKQRYWADPKPPSFDTTPSVSEELMAQEATQLIGNEIERKQSLVLKDPRLSRLLPFWRPVLKQLELNTAALISCRSPMETVASLQARDGLEVDHALALWVGHMIEAERGSRGMQRVLVTYGDLLDDPVRTLTQAVDAARLTPKIEPNAAAAQLSSFADQGARHHRASASDIPRETFFGGLTAQMFELLNRDRGLDDWASFDDLANKWNTHWAKTSPGNGPSELAQGQAAWHHQRAAVLRQNPATIHQAFSAAEEATRRSPLVNQHHVLFAQIALAVGAPKIAIDAAQTALDLGADTFAAHATLSHAAARLGENHRALEAARECLRLSPEAAGMKQLLGDLLRRIEEADPLRVKRTIGKES